MIDDRDEYAASSDRADGHGVDDMTTEMPLFPLDVVLFPGMVMPLHIFELRYREMINYCLDEKLQFGIALIDSNKRRGGVASPSMVGTAARIARANHLEDGRIDITVVGTHRFRIESLDDSRSYLMATTQRYPLTNNSTREAESSARQVRPKVLEYVELLSEASRTKLRLDRLPEDPKALAVLVAIALQVSNDEKQRLLEIASVPDILSRERQLLATETMLLRYMASTQSALDGMSIGWSGHLFPN